jgi:hypothetical protein
VQQFGGAEWIRTPGATRVSMGGIRPEFGGLFDPTKSILAGENLFAWHSILRRLSGQFVRQPEGRCSTTSSIRPGGTGFKSERHRTLLARIFAPPPFSSTAPSSLRTAMTVSADRRYRRPRKGTAPADEADSASCAEKPRRRSVSMCSQETVTRQSSVNLSERKPQAFES